MTAESTHYANAKAAAKCAAEMLAGFGEDRLAPIMRMTAGDTFDLDVELKNTDGQIVGRMRVDLHLFLHPVEKIIRTVGEK